MAAWRYLYTLRMRLLKQNLAADIHRHRDAIIIVASILPLGPSLVAWPLTTLGNLGTETAWRVASALALMTSITALWVHAFRRTIGGAGFYDYLRTLPIPRVQFRRLDSLSLLVTNFPLWLTVFLALAQRHATGPAAAPWYLYAERILLACCVFVLVQFYVLRRARSALWLALGCTCCLIASATHAESSLAGMGVAAAVAAAIAAALGFLSGLPWRPTCPDLRDSAQ